VIIEERVEEVIEGRRVEEGFGLGVGFFILRYLLQWQQKE